MSRAERLVRKVVCRLTISVPYAACNFCFDLMDAPCTSDWSWTTHRCWWLQLERSQPNQLQPANAASLHRAAPFAASGLAQPDQTTQPTKLHKGHQLSPLSQPSRHAWQAPSAPAVNACLTAGASACASRGGSHCPHSHRQRWIRPEQWEPQLGMSQWQRPLRPHRSTLHASAPLSSSHTIRQHCLHASASLHACRTPSGALHLAHVRCHRPTLW